MAKNDRDNHRDSVNRFIALANSMKDEGLSPELVSAALMTASALYTTYSVSGNAGGLTDTGVDKVAERYREELERIQDMKRRMAESGEGDA